MINELPINLTKLPISEIKETPKRYSKSIIMTGTIIKRKGFDFFCRCAESIGDSKILFKWAGIHHDKNLKISERIKFLGNLRASDLHFQLKQAEIFFLSSYDDPFPHSAIEAYTCGCKLLIPRVTGLVEIFEE